MGCCPIADLPNEKPGGATAALLFALFGLGFGSGTILRSVFARVLRDAVKFRSTVVFLGYTTRTTSDSLLVSASQSSTLTGVGVYTCPVVFLSSSVPTKAPSSSEYARIADSEV